MSSYNGITDIWTINPYAADLYSEGFSGSGVIPPPPQDNFLVDESDNYIVTAAGDKILIL